MEQFFKIVESMRWTLIVIAIGPVALAGGLLAGIKPTRAFALDGFYFGIASAWYWWRSGQVSYKRGPGVIMFGNMIVNLQDLQRYVQDVGSVNTSAAICSGLSVFLSTLSGVLGTV
jgi:hypothetical protein